MKRYLITSFLILFAVALLQVGCDSRQSQEATPDTSVEQGAVRTVLDIDGNPVEVPANPQRVVALSEPTLDGALALGVKPVGTVSGRGQQGVPSHLSELAGDIPLVGGIGNPNYEEIARVKPDLIIVDGTGINNNSEVLAILAEIAPVVFTGYAGGDWRANFTIVADALNRNTEGEAVFAEYERRVAEVSSKLGAYKDSTFSITRWQGNSASMILKELPPGRALTDLGMRRPSNQDREGRGHSEPVSLENLSEIDADYIFFGTLGGSSVSNPQAGGTADIEGARKALEQAIKTPGFTQLKAYQESHIILVEGSIWTSTGGPLLMMGIVDSVERNLLG